MTPTDVRRTQEAWLRRQGLPLLIAGRRRLPRVPAGATPWIVFLLFATSGVALLVKALNRYEDVNLEYLDPTATELTMALSGVVLFLLAVPAAVIYQFWQRKRALLAQLIAAGVVAFIWLGGLSLVGLDIDAPWADVRVAFTDRLIAMLVAYLVVYWELPSIIRWAGVRVLRTLGTLGPMIARVLPFLLLAQLLVFFTNEIWQLAYYIPKERLWALNGVLLVPIVLLIGSDTADALRKELNRDEPHNPALLEGTPFEGEVDAGRRHKLRIGEAINLMLVPMTAQLIQVGLFVFLLCAFFVGFGSIALSPELISNWTGKPAVRMQWLGIKLPIDLTMFRVSLILAVFSGLSFAASNVTDDSYRGIFLKPIIDEMEVNLAARHVYRRHG